MLTTMTRNQRPNRFDLCVDVTLRHFSNTDIVHQKHPCPLSELELIITQSGFVFAPAINSMYSQTVQKDCRASKVTYQQSATFTADFNSFNLHSLLASVGGQCFPLSAHKQVVMKLLF